jgi:hypothetical protein
MHTQKHTYRDRNASVQGILSHSHHLHIVEGVYVENCVAVAFCQHTHTEPSRFRHEAKKKNRETPSAAYRWTRLWVAHGPLSLRNLHTTLSITPTPHDHGTTRSKKELLEARRGARTHNLEIKSLTRYRLCQPGLLLLIGEREGLKSSHIARHGIFLTGSDDDYCSSNNFIVRCIENTVERFGVSWMRSGERRPEALVQQ